MISHHSNQPILISTLPNSLTVPFADFNRVIVSNKKLENINCIFKQSQGLGGLYLGDIISTLKHQLLKDNNIQAILSCMCQKMSVNLNIKSHKILAIKDTLDYPIIQHFDEAVAWIQEKRKSKINVLVHCHAGVSRSATIIIAYLIRTKNWNPVQSLQFVRQQRERAKPNVSFWNQISQYYNYWSKRKQSSIQTQLNSNIKENTCKSNIENKPQFPQQKQKLPQKVQQKLNIIVNTVAHQNPLQKISLRSKLMNKLGEKSSGQTKREDLTVEQSRKTNLTSSFIGFSHNSSINKQQSHLSQKKSLIQPRPSLTQRKDHMFSSLISQPVPAPLYISGFDTTRPKIRFT